MLMCGPQLVARYLGLFAAADERRMAARERFASD